MNASNNHDGERLNPKTHLIAAIRARNYSLEEVMSEHVDNSLGHGKARHIDLIMYNDAGYAIRDDGIGVDDINRMFCVADASAYNDYGQIGQYGIGAKDASIWLGDEMTVETVRDGTAHTMTVDWDDVHESGLWPLKYKGHGTPALGQKGTTVLIRRPRHNYHLVSSERLAKELSLTFAPALRKGVKIRVMHQLKGGKEQVIIPEAFDPELTDEVEISGEISHRGHVLKWRGRAGLSASLTDRFNGVHIAFTHRVVETTREPFGAKSAPTVYCEVVLDEKTPWKYALSDHKTKVVRHRRELMDSINAQLTELLDKSSKQASYLALKGISVPIEAMLTKALKSAGVLYHDPDEDADEGGEHGDTDHHIVKKRRKLHTPTDEGDPAKAAGKPTGVAIEWRTTEQLEGKMWSWDISGKRLVLELDADEFEPTIGWPPKARERHVVQMITSLLSHIIEMEWWFGDGKEGISAVVTPKLRNQIEEWSSSHKRIAPYLNRAILKAAS